MQIWTRRIFNLVLFFLVPALAAVAPVVLYPAVTHSFGATGFTALAIGQSTGTAFAVVCELGWSVVGPQRVARESPAQRSHTHAISIASKLCTVVVGAPVAAVVAMCVSTDYQSAAGLIAASMTVSALSPIWFLTGSNKPLLILVADSVPRLVLNLAAAVCIFLGAGLEIVAIINVVTVLASLVTLRWVLGVRIVPRRTDYREGLDTVRHHLSLTGGRAISVAYTSLTTPLVGALSPSAIALYAGTDRLMRMGLNVLTGLPSRLQSWVGSAPPGRLVSRSRQSLAANFLLGLAAGCAFVLLAPSASAFLYSGTIDVSGNVALVATAIVVIVCTSRGAGLSLVAEGKSNWIALANVVAAITGVASLVLLVPPLGAVGGLLGVLGAELAGLLVQLFALTLVPSRNRTLREE